MKITPVCLLLLMYTLAKSQTEIPLYSGAIPNAKKVADNEWTEKTDNGITVIHNITIPTLTIYEAPKAKATGTTPSFIKSMREKGHNMKSLDKYITLKSVLGE